MLSFAKTQIFLLVLFEAKMGQKPYVRVFFPKAGVIPTHRACSTGETRTPASSHKSFSYNFGVPASVEGGLLGSASRAGAGDGASPRVRA